jgi:outer membrane protein OmpA-like peptidoglycan-associated protein
VDELGCPLEISKIEQQLLDSGLIRTSNILFETSKADLKPESRRVLDDIGRTLRQWPSLEIEIGGHTDSRGSEAFNKALSDRRAKAVRDYLVKNFPKIRPNNLRSMGYGESTPIATNDTVAGRAKNRRVEFKVLNEEQLRREIERRQR